MAWTVARRRMGSRESLKRTPYYGVGRHHAFYRMPDTECKKKSSLKQSIRSPARIPHILLKVRGHRLAFRTPASQRVCIPFLTCLVVLTLSVCPHILIIIRLMNLASDLSFCAFIHFVYPPALSFLNSILFAILLYFSTVPC